MPTLFIINSRNKCYFEQVVRNSYFQLQICRKFVYDTTTKLLSLLLCFPGSSVFAIARRKLRQTILGATKATVGVFNEQNQSEKRRTFLSTTFPSGQWSRQLAKFP